MTTTTDEILTTLSIGTPSDDPLDISESTESISDQEENGLITWIMIFSAAGLVFIVLLVAAIIFCKRKENKRQGIPESQPLRFILLNPYFSSNLSTSIFVKQLFFLLKGCFCLEFPEIEH